MDLPETVAYRVFDEHDLIAIGQRADRDLRQANRRHDAANHQPRAAGCLHGLPEGGTLPSVLSGPVDGVHVGERGRERRDRRLSHSHLDADRAQDDRDVEAHGELGDRACVELDDPSILLEDLPEHAVLVIDQQQRAVRCVPDATGMFTHVLASALGESCSVRRTVAVSKYPSKSTIFPSRTVQTWTSGTSYSVFPPLGRPIWRSSTTTRSPTSRYSPSSPRNSAGCSKTFARNSRNPSWPWKVPPHGSDSGARHSTCGSRKASMPGTSPRARASLKPWTTAIPGSLVSVPSVALGWSSMLRVKPSAG